MSVSSRDKHPRTLSAVVSAWRWFGLRSAVGMVSAFYALALLVGLTLATSLAEGVGVALFTAFVLYCFARPRAGWEDYGLALFPGATAWILHGLTGAPRWVGLLLIPVALWMARAEDRKDADATRLERAAPTSSPAALSRIVSAGEGALAIAPSGSRRARRRSGARGVGR